VLGHEGTGVVESVGEGVSHVKAGDKVLLNWAIPCRTCYQCQTGHQNICEKNSPVTGTNPDDGAAHVGSTIFDVNQQRLDMCLFEWDKIYMNPLYGMAMPEHDFPKLLELYSQGALKLDELVTRTYVLENLQQAINDMMAGRNAKGVVVFPSHV